MLDLSKPWRRSRFAAFDLETTGRDIEKAQIIEIGLVVFEDGEVVERWQQFVNPGVPLPPEITTITGIKDEDLVGQPPLALVVDELVDRLTRDVLLAYNHEYDLGVVRAELARLGRTEQLPPCLDPFPFCWVHLREAGLTKNAKLGDVSEYLGVKLENAHRAADDAEAAGRVLLELANRIVVPERLEELLGLQRALMQQVKESFARFRRRSGGDAVLSGNDHRIELGMGYLYHAEETDPLKYLFSTIPDIRDTRSS